MTHRPVTCTTTAPRPSTDTAFLEALFVDNACRAKGPHIRLLQEARAQAVDSSHRVLPRIFYGCHPALPHLRRAGHYREALCGQKQEQLLDLIMDPFAVEAFSVPFKYSTPMQEGSEGLHARSSSAKSFAGHVITGLLGTQTGM
ncbi:hypothetical protein WJX84_003037 [Apatococcus fuscideae]|uniref:Uncharacterized protein n=1 Tax=Apatococcus fuscideae TaxID=2026836 RepID=A0AAW1RYM8_9CHLO